MLVLSRGWAEWVTIRDREGNQLRVMAREGRRGDAGKVEFVFDDADRNFEVERPTKDAEPDPESNPKR